MKKIVIDARILRTSTGRYVEQLLEYLQDVDADRSHRYIVLLKPKDMDSWEPKSKRFTKVASPFKEFSFGEQIGLLVQLVRLRPNLVHFTMVQQPILYQGAAITTMHDLTTLRFDNPSKNPFIFQVKQRIYYIVNYIAAHKSRSILTPSEYVKNDVARSMRVNSRKITVTYEAGHSLGGSPEAIPELEEKPFIMYVGRPNPHKNLDRLLEAFSLIKQHYPDMRLVLSGRRDALFRHYERMVKRLGIPDVHFTGHVTDGQLKWLYAHTAAYIFPSLSEGFGLPGLEAMAYGAPVVASNTTSLPEIYGDAAAYFDPLDSASIAEAIELILKKPALRAEMIERGREQAKQYSWKRMAEQTLATYQTALDA